MSPYTKCQLTSIGHRPGSQCTGACQSDLEHLCPRVPFSAAIGGTNRNPTTQLRRKSSSGGENLLNFIDCEKSRKSRKFPTSVATVLPRGPSPKHVMIPKFAVFMLILFAFHWQHPSTSGEKRRAPAATICIFSDKISASLNLRLPQSPSCLRRVRLSI